MRAIVVLFLCLVGLCALLAGGLYSDVALVGMGLGVLVVALIVQNVGGEELSQRERLRNHHHDR